MPPLEKAIEGSGSGEAVLSVFRATNLLSSFEMIRIQDVLRGPDADTFIRAGARFTMGETKARARSDGTRAAAPGLKETANVAVLNVFPPTRRTPDRFL